jgi:hypothetical protein
LSSKPEFIDFAFESPFSDRRSSVIPTHGEWESEAISLAGESPFGEAARGSGVLGEGEGEEAAAAPGDAEAGVEWEQWADAESGDRLEAAFETGLEPELEIDRETFAWFVGADPQELENTAEQLYEEQIAPPSTRPTAATVDDDAAEPLFSGSVRVPDAPLLAAATLAASSRYNRQQHPAISGITLAELRTRLEQYLDRPALDALIRRSNAGSAAPIATDDGTIVTLLAHQFQRRTCRTPSVGDVLKACTVDGRVAEDTLDALGFVYHTGKTLNTADRANTVASATLNRVTASAFTGVEPGLTARTWWTYMVSPPWLGLPIKQGIHLVLLRKLRRAQRALMRLPAYAGLSPAELGRVLGVTEEHKGARPGSNDWSMHLFGLGIDVGYTRNPWLSNPQRNTAKLAAISLRAARLTGASGANAGISARWLHNLATTQRETAKVHKALAEWSQWLEQYFALAGNPKRIEGLLPVANVVYPDGGWFKSNETLADAAVRWSRSIRTDFDDFATAVARAGNKDQVRHGFMDLARDLVMALRDDACLGWGAVDFGPAASGDVMHFDCRVDGIGRAIALASGRPFVPTSGHPCLPVAPAAPQHELDTPLESERREDSWEPEAESSEWGPPPGALSVRRPSSGEASAWGPPSGGPFEGQVQKKAPPPPICTAPATQAGHWLVAAPSRALPQYKDIAGKKQSTGCAINVPDALWRKKKIDLMVFFHGDPGPCKDCFDPTPGKFDRKFGLDTQILNGTRKVALAVPVLHWIPGNKTDDANIKGVWTAANLNAFVAEVLDEIAAQSGMKDKIELGSLTLAGHSHAYGIFTPLALEFNQGAAATKQGALKNLQDVWALDSTYGIRSVRALEAWAYTVPHVRFAAILNKTRAKAGYSPRPIDGWMNYYSQYQTFGFTAPANLRLSTVDEGHCAIPTKYVGNLLSTTKSSPDWARP